MPRGSQLRGEGGVFHLTQRCHNQAFLLKYARDRDAYRAKLREHLHQFDMALLDHCLASNHVHLLVDAEKRLEVWTESLAVGSSSFVERIQPLILSRSETETVETDSKLWVLRARPALTVKKRASKALVRPQNEAVFDISNCPASACLCDTRTHST